MVRRISSLHCFLVSHIPCLRRHRSTVPQLSVFSKHNSFFLYRYDIYWLSISPERWIFNNFFSITFSITHSVVHLSGRKVRSWICNKSWKNSEINYRLRTKPHILRCNISFKTESLFQKKKQIDRFLRLPGRCNESGESSYRTDWIIRNWTILRLWVIENSVFYNDLEKARRRTAINAHTYSHKRQKID